MRFRMLGPLEASRDDNVISLGGTKQRATLGFLLLNANRVVATRRLLKALWPGEAPPSARKIIQNAVWALRGQITCDEPAKGSTALVTQAPGYMLQVDPDQIDLYCFERLSQQGRAELATGSPERAVTPLQEALALWRGPAMADLVETGINWPELATVQNVRLDTMEDYFEAELARGRHHAVLSGLEAMVEAEPLRERPCGQFMLALYRCGRQADALNVYSRMRSRLAEDLGLEPGRYLQWLQYAILTHDPALILGAVPQLGTPGIDVAAPSQAVVTVPAELAEAPRAAAPARTPEPALEDDTTAVARPAELATAVRRTATLERKHVTALVIRARLDSEINGAEPSAIDETLRNAAATIRAEVECYGGTLAGSIGSVSLALFGIPGNRRDAAERAVCAALAIRNRLMNPDTGALPILDIRAAVATGEVLVRHESEDSDAPPMVNGPLLDESQDLLSLTPNGEIRVCDNTHRATGSAFSYCERDAFGGWQVRGARTDYIGSRGAPIIDRERELEVLHGLLERVRHRASPHLVTVLGEAGHGKTRLITEFERRVVGSPGQVQFLTARVPPYRENNALAVLTDLVSCYCGILPVDPYDMAKDKLGKTVRRLLGSAAEWDWLVSCLGPLIDNRHGRLDLQPQACDVMNACRQFLEEIALDQPLVLVIDDFHEADVELLGLVENLAESLGSSPLLVVVTARMELLKRRPDWGGGKRHAATITLDPLSDAAVDRMLEFLLQDRNGRAREPGEGWLGAILTHEESEVRRQCIRQLMG